MSYRSLYLHAVYVVVAVDSGVRQRYVVYLHLAAEQWQHLDVHLQSLAAHYGVALTVERVVGDGKVQWEVEPERAQVEPEITVLSDKLATFSCGMILYGRHIEQYHCCEQQNSRRRKYDTHDVQYPSAFALVFFHAIDHVSLNGFSSPVAVTFSPLF